MPRVFDSAPLLISGELPAARITQRRFQRQVQMTSHSLDGESGRKGTGLALLHPIPVTISCVHPHDLAILFGESYYLAYWAAAGWTLQSK
jgi:hypothetical protein